MQNRRWRCPFPMARLQKPRSLLANFLITRRQLGEKEAAPPVVCVAVDLEEAEGDVLYLDAGLLQADRGLVVSEDVLVGGKVLGPGHEGHAVEEVRGGGELLFSRDNSATTAQKNRLKSQAVRKVSYSPDTFLTSLGRGRIESTFPLLSPQIPKKFFDSTKVSQCFFNT